MRRLVVVWLLLLAACALPETGTATTFTLPVEGSRILVIGDWGAGTEEQRQVAETMRELAAKKPIQAILTAGDNFYSDDEQELTRPFLWVFESGIPFWISWGNHDVESAKRIDDVNSTFGDPPRWVVHHWGHVDVVILDSTQVAHPEQLAFLRDYLQTSTRPSIIVFHHPAWSCSVHGASEAILDTWVSLFDSDVVLTLSGHDHNYQRFKDSGITFVVTGGGGASISDVGNCPRGHPDLISGEESHHFLVLDLIADSLILTAVAVAGTIIDQTVLAIPE